MFSCILECSPRFLFKLGFGIKAGLFPVVKYIGDAPDEFYDYEAVGFYNDHENGAIFSVLDNSGDQFITLFQNAPKVLLLVFFFVLFFFKIFFVNPIIILVCENTPKRNI